MEEIYKDGRTSSIELTRNAKGDYSYKIKVYFDQKKDNDTDVIKNKKERERILLHFKKGKIDLLLGTQLLVHQAGLSPVSLVVVLYPETILTLSDFRASQKTFQSLHQMRKFVRDDEKSEFLVQTALPHHFSIQQAAFGEYICFFNKEIKFSGGLLIKINFQKC